MNVFPSVGTALPPRRDQLVQAASAPRSDDSGSIIIPEARDRLLEIFRRRQTPMEVHSTLDASCNGNLREEQLLIQAMIDTWPRLQKCLGEIRRAAEKAPWKVLPWAPRGGAAKPESEMLAKEVENDIWSMRPNPLSGRMEIEETIGELAVGYYYGHHVLEIAWSESWGGKPLNTKIVPARYYGYPYDTQGEDRLMLDPKGDGSLADFEDFPPHKFLVSIKRSHAGHPTMAAPLRALVGYWLAAVYGLKWFLGYAEKFGQPLRWATYATGDAKAKADIMKMMENIGANAWGIFPSGTDVKFVANTQSAATLPQRELISLADEQCDIFVLGQTLTGSVSKDGGSRALGDVHMDVRQDVIAGICGHVGRILTQQLCRSIVALNYGDGREDIPEIAAVFPEAKDEKAMAERDQILDLGGKMPVAEQWYYERHGVPMPAATDKLFQAAPNGVPGDPVPGSILPHETKDGLEKPSPKPTVTAADGDPPQVSKLVELMKRAIEKGTLVDEDAIASILAAAWVDEAKPKTAE